MRVSPSASFLNGSRFLGSYLQLVIFLWVTVCITWRCPSLIFSCWVRVTQSLEKLLFELDYHCYFRLLFGQIDLCSDDVTKSHYNHGIDLTLSHLLFVYRHLLPLGTKAGLEVKAKLQNSYFLDYIWTYCSNRATGFYQHCMIPSFLAFLCWN